ncbi:hypothetical protein SISSUDRAFT_1033537 [Sistotremastrum suecicum HHB10207 ss-3]|uniref:Uncharacterized protein n=1 Tax=Sistotremastrum suecicum HHB10207 ss-3 TaxID=1314776 RepID=A0A166D7I6_9AGAM|nr:hypothetical protein SISSUDRAFT_1033537 [Sistotremastrum suecicum HHB10207 ss-3]
MACSLRMIASVITTFILFCMFLGYLQEEANESTEYMQRRASGLNLHSKSSTIFPHPAPPCVNQSQVHILAVPKMEKYEAHVYVPKKLSPQHPHALNASPKRGTMRARNERMPLFGKVVKVSIVLNPVGCRYLRRRMTSFLTRMVCLKMRTRVWIWIASAFLHRVRVLVDLALGLVICSATRWEVSNVP